MALRFRLKSEKMEAAGAVFGQTDLSHEQQRPPLTNCRPSFIGRWSRFFPPLSTPSIDRVKQRHLSADFVPKLFFLLIFHWNNTHSELIHSKCDDDDDVPDPFIRRHLASNQRLNKRQKSSVGLCNFLNKPTKLLFHAPEVAFHQPHPAANGQRISTNGLTHVARPVLTPVYQWTLVVNPVNNRQPRPQQPKKLPQIIQHKKK